MIKKGWRRPGRIKVAFKLGTDEETGEVRIEDLYQMQFTPVRRALVSWNPKTKTGELKGLKHGGHHFLRHKFEKDSWGDTTKLDSYFNDQEIEFYSARQVTRNKTQFKAFNVRAPKGKSLEPAIRPPNPFVSFDIVEGGVKGFFSDGYVHYIFNEELEKSRALFVEEPEIFENKCVQFDLIDSHNKENQFYTAMEGRHVHNLKIANDNTVLITAERDWSFEDILPEIIREKATEDQLENIRERYDKQKKSHKWSQIKLNGLEKFEAEYKRTKQLKASLYQSDKKLMTDLSGTLVGDIRKENQKQQLNSLEVRKDSRPEYAPQEKGIVQDDKSISSNEQHSLRAHRKHKIRQYKSSKHKK